MKYTCLIVDDNEIERDAIEMHLRKIDRLEIKFVCANGLEAAEILLNEPIDIVFSDIDMPELSGMALLKSIKTVPIFIFITSFSEYATESFNLDAIDFIVKPASFERLLKASHKAIAYLDLKKSATKIEAPTLLDDHFFLKESKGLSKIKYAGLIYVESMGDFSKFFTADKQHITLVNLKNIEKQLPPYFLRVHKQYIVNINHIDTITTNEIHLNHDFVIPISLVNRQELIAKVADKTLTRQVK